MPPNLGFYEGLRDPAHLARWLTALTEGKNRLPRCVGTTKLGRKCKHIAMIGSDRCCFHLVGTERDRVDEVRIARYRRLSRLSDIGERGREKARTALAHIERRRLHRAWKLDPTIPGTTLVLNPHHEKRVIELLRVEFEIDLDEPLPGTNRLPTPRCIDRLRWAAVLYLQQKIDMPKFKARIRQAVSDDERFFNRLDTMMALELFGPETTGET